MLPKVHLRVRWSPRAGQVANGMRMNCNCSPGVGFRLLDHGRSNAIQLAFSA